MSQVLKEEQVTGQGERVTLAEGVLRMVKAKGQWRKQGVGERSSRKRSRKFWRLLKKLMEQASRGGRGKWGKRRNRRTETHSSKAREKDLTEGLSKDKVMGKGSVLGKGESHS